MNFDPLCRAIDGSQVIGPAAARRYLPSDLETIAIALVAFGQPA